MLRSDELEELSRYAAGELPAAEVARVEAAIASRQELGQALARLRALDTLAAGMGADTLRALDDELIARAVSAASPRRRPLRLAFAFAGAAALAASVALVLWPRAATPTAHLSVLSGTIELHGARLGPGTSAAVREGDPLQPGAEAVIALSDASGRALLSPGSSATWLHGGAISLEAGTVITSGTSTLTAGGVVLRLDGLVVVSTEPSQALAQATLVSSSTPEGDPMKNELKAWRGGGFKSAAGAALALWVIHGSALAAAPGAAPVTVREGGSWSNGPASAALVAGADPAAASGPGGSARARAVAAARGAGASTEVFQNLERSEVIATLTERGRFLGLCLRKEIHFKDGTETVADPPRALRFTAELQLTAREGEVVVTDLVLSDESVPLEKPVRRCLSIVLQYKLDFPRPHPGPLATVRLPIRLETTPDGDVDEWFGEAPAPVRFHIGLTLPSKSGGAAGLAPAAGPIDESGDPTAGPASAPVTIVEFTDFQCSYCKRVNDTLLALQQTYGDKVRFVFKQNPLPMHPLAGPAAQAVLAAHAQGRFEEYRKLLYYGGGSLSREQLQSYALLAGLDLPRFLADLDANRFEAQIRADQAEAKRLGVTFVPAFFVNGRPLEGAQPVDKFIELIDAELAKR